MSSHFLGNSMKLEHVYLTSTGTTCGPLEFQGPLGAYFDKSEPWNDDTYSKVESLIPLAPLHNKAHLVGYNAFKKVLPSVPQIAVFDTAFHQSMDAEDYTFPIP